MSHLKRGADGHLLRNAAGHLVRDCYSCSNCDSTPSQIEVVFSGISYSTNCLIYGSNSQTAPSVPYVNGTWILPQTSVCEWIYQEEGSFGSINHYSGVLDCSGSPTSRSLGTFQIRLFKHYTNYWSILARYFTVSPLATVYIFQRADQEGTLEFEVSNQDCSDFVADNGQETSLSYSNYQIHAGYGGIITATVL